MLHPPQEMEQDHYNILRELECVLCLEITERAMQLTCCHKLMCAAHRGELLDRCPHCTEREFGLVANVPVRRIVGRLSVVCPLCGVRGERGNLQDHLQNVHPVPPPVRRTVRLPGPGVQEVRAMGRGRMLAARAEVNQPILRAGGARVGHRPRPEPRQAVWNPFMAQGP